ncbi:hypothetical protein J1N35_038958 [Gossypium stocksii]|uniref:Epidermal patterning factor-like protein n=1 Tax=Gossypium stocksii TaxID=47602 RepID=A0A9D3UNR6_9ROSI|nr:hypothetical protein J1N35_038958 [Gossypium stocksii]
MALELINQARIPSLYKFPWGQVQAQKKSLHRVTKASRPSCEHKCYGCTPCEAIQVPTTPGKQSHVSLQSTNYEPESWKCKCGPTFYSHDLL